MFGVFFRQVEIFDEREEEGIGCSFCEGGKGERKEDS